MSTDIICSTYAATRSICFDVIESLLEKYGMPVWCSPRRDPTERNIRYLCKTTALSVTLFFLIQRGTRPIEVPFSFLYLQPFIFPLRTNTKWFNPLYYSGHTCTFITASLQLLSRICAFHASLHTNDGKWKIFCSNDRNWLPLYMALSKSIFLPLTFF